jgi:hypothetical protein
VVGGISSHNAPSLSIVRPVTFFTDGASSELGYRSRIGRVISRRRRP